MRDRTLRRRSWPGASSRDSLAPWGKPLRSTRVGGSRARNRSLLESSLAVGALGAASQSWLEARESSSASSPRALRQRFLNSLQDAMALQGQLLRVSWHRNQHRMLQIRLREGVWHFRLHRLFLRAPSTLILELARYAKEHDARAAQALREFVDAQEDHAVEVERARGTYFDLDAILQSLNVRFFAGAVVARIAWLEGEDWPGLEEHCDEVESAAQGLAMAAYCVETQQIWVHRSLDAADIPRVYLDWVVFHEMLHQLHEMPFVGQRRLHHSPAFERDEAKFPGREEALSWERSHRQRLQHALEQPIQRLGQ